MESIVKQKMAEDLAGEFVSKERARRMAFDFFLTGLVLFFSVVALLTLLCMIDRAEAADFDPRTGVTAYEIAFWKVAGGAVQDTVFSGEAVDIEFLAPSGTMAYNQQLSAAGLADTLSASSKRTIQISGSSIAYTTAAAGFTGAAELAPITLDPGFYLWAVRASNQAGWSKYSDPRTVLVTPREEPPVPDRPVTIRIRTVVH